MAYSKVTKKGQVTIPSRYREQLRLGEGTIVAFKESKEGLVLEAVPDIADSAGTLSRFAPAEEVIRDTLRSRERDLR